MKEVQLWFSPELIILFPLRKRLPALSPRRFGEGWRSCSQPHPSLLVERGEKLSGGILMALRAGARSASSSSGGYFTALAASFSSSWRPVGKGTLLFAPEEQKCKKLHVKLCQKHRVSFVNEKISLLLLPLPFWWSMHRWVTPPFNSVDSATKQPPLASPLSGGLASMRDLWTTALRADSSSHMIEITEAKGSGHLSVHPLHGEGSPAV